MRAIKNYRDLDAWQAAMDLAVFTYQITDKFPRSELFGLTAHSRKSSVSIPSNIAEGHELSTPSYIQHLLFSGASCAELETQFELSRRLSFLTIPDWRTSQQLTSRSGQLINGLLRSLGHRWDR